MNIFLMLVLLHNPVGYQEKLEAQETEPGYSVLHYNLDHHNYSIPVKIHTQVGCLVTFSQPFDDAWASDNRGNATGEFYKFLRWGTHKGKSLQNQLVISSVLFTEKHQNVFVMVGGKVIELTLSQTKDYAKADRRITVNFSGGQESEVFLPKREPEKEEKAPTTVLLGTGKNKTTQALNGTMVYNLGDDPFVYYTPKKGMPKLEKIEIVRVKKRRFSQSFKYEVPIKATVEQVGDGTLLKIPPYQLEKGEHFYLRVKYEGERTAKVKKLKKQRWWRR